MQDLLAARSQMAVSLGFHIIFASIGMAMPFLMAISHYRWIRTGETVYLDLTKAWSRGVAIFFATGAVSGTALSFELGLLWPKFMEHAGPIIGMPFSWEGTAFFLEAIALGLFLYGWNRLSPWVHWGVGLTVGITGVLSGIFVVCANAWMNSPAGFDWVDGQALNIDPVRAMFNPGWKTQTLHMTLAAFEATGFAVGGIHALLLLRRPASALHREAFKIALLIGSIAALLQPLSGDRLAKGTAQRQPAKLAAMEAHFHTENGASLILGGIPDLQEKRVRYAVKLPTLLSFLAHGDFHAQVKGLEDFPEKDWPPVLIVHTAFQAMVGAGSALAALGLAFLVLSLRRSRLLLHRRFLLAAALATPLGFLALEAGWVVTEVGRQPWIIYGIMRTAEAVTPMPGLVYPFLLFTAVYFFLAAVVSWLMLRHIRAADREFPSASSAEPAGSGSPLPEGSHA
ncbi:MAG: cytochrome bd-type quinol oxidase subunit 1 [Fibrobacteres bacterium]|nr:cytochrome bd-type quinol oxidase subunit 1 [Fibrobacterota bacterium]